MNKGNQADCTAFPYIREGKQITINKTHCRIEKKINCKNTMQYIQLFANKIHVGKYTQEKPKILLKFGLADHMGYVVNKDTTTATGHHFNLPGHNMADKSITVVEQVQQIV